MTRHVTRADLERVFQSTATTIVDLFNERGTLTPVVCGVRFKDEQWRPCGSFPSAFASVFFESEEGKEALMLVVRDLLGGELRDRVPDLVPEIVIVITEGWAAKSKSQDVLESQKERYGSIENIPGRDEVIAIQLHTLDGTSIGLCRINAETRKATVGELADGTLGGIMTMQGDDQ